MQGVQCEYCRKFSAYVFSPPNMFGGYAQTMPANWIIMTEEKPQHVMSGLLDVLSTATSEPKLPSVFCSRVCLRDWLVAATLIDGPAAS